MRDIPVGNGSLLVTFDDKYQIRDVYFPHVGQENHTEGFPFRFGVWADGEFSWVSEDAWRRELKYLPETLVTADRRQIMRFHEKHGDIIVKPLFGNGGAGVFHLRPDDSNLNALVEMFTERSREPLVVQRYVPEVRKGDKRIILVDGVAMGAINRVPAKGESRSNMHVGGKAEKTTLTPREREICERIGPELKARGMIFVGIDVIGDYLTEINVTSPTGLQEIARFDGVRLEKAIWDAIEAKRG